MIKRRTTSRNLAHAAVAVALAVAALSCGPEGGDDARAPRWERAFDTGDQGWLLSVAGAAADDVYAAGGMPREGHLWHFDGQQWTAETLPEGTRLLNWVHVFADGEPIVAGNAGTILRRVDGQWQLEETPSGEDLWGVWGANPDDIWAVGGSGRQANAATVLHYYDGTWHQPALPELERPNVRAFFKVWGTSADNVYIVGQSGAVLHWDGEALEEVLVGTGQDLISLWGTSPDNIVMVGGRSNGVLVHYDGESWTPRQLAPLPGINGVWLDASGDGWLAGNAGTLAKISTVGEVTTEQVDVETPLELHAVFGLGDGQAFSVGGSLQSPTAPYQGVVMHREKK